MILKNKLRESSPFKQLLKFVKTLYMDNQCSVNLPNEIRVTIVNIHNFSL